MSRGKVMSERVATVLCVLTIFVGLPLAFATLLLLVCLGPFFALVTIFTVGALVAMCVQITRDCRERERQSRALWINRRRRVRVDRF